MSNLRVLLIAAGFALSACASSPANSPAISAQCELSAAQTSALDSIVQGAIDDRRVPGVVLALNYRGATYRHAYGYANIERQTPMSEDTSFWVMSINKTFTAAAIMRLAERGQLNLDDPLSRYLPDFPHAGEVTIRQLLNHTSGIREFLAQPAARRDPLIEAMRADPSLGVPELLRFMTGMTPNLFEFEPGTSWKYSNSNYVLLGAVIESLSGEPWQDYLRQNFWAPLGLRNTEVDNPQNPPSNRAVGYVMTDAGAFTAGGDLPRNVAGPAGSLRSTADDLLTWQLALTSGNVLGPASMRAMREPARLRDGTLVREGRPDWVAPGAEYMYSYGMGFMLLDDGAREAFGHIGNFPGFEAVMQTYPDQDLTLIILTNRHEAATLLTPRIAQAILDNDASMNGCAPTTP